MADPIPVSLLRRIAPRALRGYARSLGWLRVEGVNGDIEVLHRPDSKLHQLIVPLDTRLDDYTARVGDAIQRLAEYERCPVRQVLDRLLVRPADVLRFREESEESEEGTVLLARVPQLVGGIRKALAAVAYSETRPNAFHQRLSGGGDAEDFVGSCRFGQTERGSFTFSVVCPLGTHGGDLFDARPYARRVTTGLVRTLADVTAAVDRGNVGDLLDRTRFPLLSANLCEALAQLRPAGDRSSVVVTPEWSRAIASDASSTPSGPVIFYRECFEATEYLAPRLRTAPDPEPELHIGRIDVLRGVTGADGRRAGEVHITVLVGDGESVRARADLAPEAYAEAIEAHKRSEPVRFEAVLTRLPRLSQLASVQNFQRLGHAHAGQNGSHATGS